MGVRTTRLARDDLAQIHAWSCAQWGDDHAHQFLEGLFSALDRLAEQPKMGRVRKLIHPDIRSISYRPYDIYYVIAPDSAAVIVAVWHTRRHHRKVDLLGRSKHLED